MTYLEESGLGQANLKSFLLENFEVTDEEAESYVKEYEMYEQYG